MCAIVDANVMGQFTKTSSEAAKLMLRWISSQGRMVYNVELVKEYSTNHDFLNFVRQMERAGRTKLVDVNSNDLGNDANACVSNDRHIVALAKASRASVLFSLDQNLHTDFKNNSIVGRHDRIVFQSVDHRAQLYARRCP